MGCKGSKSGGSKENARGRSDSVKLSEAPDQFEPKYQELDPATITATAALPSTDPNVGLHDGELAGKKILILEYTDQSAFDRLGLTDAIYLSNLKHANIIELVGICPAPSNYILYQPAAKLTLQTALMRAEPSPADLVWPQAVGLMVGICKALQYLHLHPAGEVLHGGITASAVLVTKDWQPKLCDFGRAFLHNKDGQATAIDCTVPYTAPEVLTKNKIYVRGSDIYSVGILFSTILARREPFIGKYKNDQNKIFQAIFAEERPELPEWTPDSLKQLTASCVQTNLLNRPEAKQMLKTLERMKKDKKADFKIPYSSVVYDTPVDEAAEFGINVGKDDADLC